jgi:signal transduction histidine kinase
MIDSTLKKANILIVDDQEAYIDVLEGLLEMQGYTNVISTTDPRQVVSLFSSFQPDLILLDLSMPYMSGFEVMDQLKSSISANTYLPILVLTADATLEAKKRALSGGAIDFLTKPFDLIEVGLRIRNLIYTSYLQQQLLNQNQILEEKVAERTYELEKQNIELIVAKEKAEASDRLKSHFINNISHEIRTPLNGILGFGQILIDPGFSPEEKEQYSEMLNSCSSRLINTVTNFMDISLLTSGNQKVYKKEIKPENLIKEVVSKFKDICDEKMLQLSFSTPSLNDNLKIVTDGDSVSKILYQLIDNAVKFTHDGILTIGYEQKGNNLIFFVRDTGIGISEKNRNRIFDSFIQEDDSNTRRYEGNGLGLSIAKGFVHLLDGKIWLDSEISKGSTFYFSLPCLQQILEDSSELPHTVISKPRQQTILIAEEDEINFCYFKALLTGDLINIIHATDGIEALDFCHEHPEIELVLMDLKMIEMDGFETTRRIKSFRPELPVIAITAYSESEDKRKALRAGCDEFLTKPLKKEFLLKKLEDFGISRYN